MNAELSYRICNCHSADHHQIAKALQLRDWYRSTMSSVNDSAPDRASANCTRNAEMPSTRLTYLQHYNKIKYLARGAIVLIVAQWRWRRLFILFIASDGCDRAKVNRDPTVHLHFYFGGLSVAHKEPRNRIKFNCPFREIFTQFVE